MYGPRNPRRNTRRYVPKSDIRLQTDRYQAYYLGKVNAAEGVKYVCISAFTKEVKGDQVN